MSQFSETVEKYFKEGIETDPLWASDLGFEEYDDIMPDGTREETIREADLSNRFLKDVTSFNNSELSEEEQIDKEVLDYALNLRKFQFEEIETWRRFPSAGAVGSAIYSLISKDTPPEKRLKSIVKRMKKMPLFLENSKECLDKPVWLWLEMAIESSHRMKGFIDFVEKFGQDVTKDSELLNELKIDAINVKNAFKAYEQWLYEKQTGASKEFAMSKDKYNELLKKRMLPYSSDEILEIGEEYVKSIGSKMREVANTIDKTAEVKDILTQIKSGHKENFASIMSDCKKVMNEAREFVKNNNFATIPSEEILEIQETPIFMRHLIPFAAYSPPGKFEKIQKGIYMMTPPDVTEEQLTEFCFEDLVSTSVHEAYPGHHLQFACANLNPSLARLYSHATEFIEGWAHYCEEATAEAGFYNSPQATLIRLKDMLWRAWRIIIDVKLSTGEMSFETAVSHLVEDAGLEHMGALGEVKRYTYTPGYPLSYLLGKHMLLEIKNKIKTKYAKVWSQKEFHDILLNAGSLPLGIMEKVLELKFSSKKI